MNKVLTEKAILEYNVIGQAQLSNQMLLEIIDLLKEINTKLKRSDTGG